MHKNETSKLCQCANKSSVDMSLMKKSNHDLSHPMKILATQ